MNDLVGGTGELRMVVHIKRKATGETETVELVSVITDKDAEKLGLTKEQDDGRNS